MKNNAFVNQIKNVRDAGQSYLNSNILSDTKKEIESFLVPYKELILKFRNLKNVYFDMQKIDNTISEDFTKLYSYMQELKIEISKNNYSKHLLSLAKKEIDRISANLNSKWREYIERNTSAINGVLRTLGNLISEGQSAKLEQKKFMYTNSSPGNQNAVNALNEYIKIYNELMLSLDLSEDKLEFLKLLTSTKRVTISQITPDLFEWLNKSEFANKIYLEIK